MTPDDIRKIIVSYVILWLRFRFTMDAAIMCLGCGRDITKEKGNRLLRTTTSGHVVTVVPLWSSLMDEEWRSRGIPSLGVAHSLVDRDGRMCRQCFTIFEKVSKLWVTLKNSISEAAIILISNTTTVCDPSPVAHTEVTPAPS